ncbi:Hsp70-Hsp90 organizing protein 2 (AtHop2) [Durusdinium trenchii]|uniref:Hsp70-Hsp90 organizing protein 2 (AtHop2) n=1 Tax=Durusdinium trenchii TaxID=1381693 RepID=A0ABP0Q0M4_9DINO
MTRSHFGWTPASKSTKKAEEILTKARPVALGARVGHVVYGPGPPGRGPDLEMGVWVGTTLPEEFNVGDMVGCLEEDVFVMRREDLCAALEDGQDDQKAIYRIHLDKAALDKACETVCLADLFAVDVMEQYLKVFIRGDEKSPILMGQLFEKVQPDQSRWEIVKAAAPVDESGQAPVNLYNTCLQVSLTKAKASKKHWPHLMVENELVLQREAAPAIEELHSKAIRAPSPDRSGWSPEELAKDFKSKADSCFKSSAWRDAVVYYTRALSHMPEDEKLFSNRSACYVKLKKFDKALVDAKKCASLKPEWSKAYFRVGQAHRGLRQWEDALAAFREGRFREPTNKEWEKEISKTEEEQEKWDAHVRRLGSVTVGTADGLAPFLTGRKKEDEFVAQQGACQLGPPNTVVPTGTRGRDQRKLKREADLVTELNEAKGRVEAAGSNPW